MIGPAEIEEMMAELAERIAVGTGKAPEPSWPVFVGEDGPDEVDRRLVRPSQPSAQHG